MNKEQHLTADGHTKEGAILRSPHSGNRPIAVVHLERVIWFTPNEWERVMQYPGSFPEGCTPHDCEMLRHANGALAQEATEFQQQIEQLMQMLDRFEYSVDEWNFDIALKDDIKQALDNHYGVGNRPTLENID